MKKWLSMVCAAALVLSLGACGAEKETPAEPEMPPAPVEEPAAPETVELEYYLEGEPVTLTAERYVGDGYTVDIPAEGWLREQGDEDGFASVSWEPQVNDDVELEIIKLTGKTVEEARSWVQREEDDYDLIQDKRGGLGGSDRTDGDVLEVRFYEAADGVFALLLSWPMEASEGFGVTLSVMADSFVIG